jgi:tRNA(Ile)-lysidine synthase
VALRAERASAPGGLAGMTAVAEWRNTRLLRPLLGVAKARLVATAKAHGLAWVEDPSNLDPAFARARLRRSGGALPSLGDMRARQERRMGAEARAARDLADCVAIHPAGYARLDHESWRKLPSERRSFVAARLAMTVGGLAYPPRQDRLSRFVARFGGADTAGSATLGRCLWRRAGLDVLVARESRHLPAALDVEPGTCTRWDGRFLVKSSNPDVRVAALGAGGWRHLRELGVDGALPEAAAVALPAFHDLEGLVAVPHLQWQRRDAAACRFSAGFAPHHALGPAGFAAFVDCDPASGGGAY